MNNCHLTIVLKYQTVDGCYGGCYDSRYQSIMHLAIVFLVCVGLASAVGMSSNDIDEYIQRAEREGPNSENADISNIYDMFRRLKKLLTKKINTKEFKEQVEKIFGKRSELAEQIIHMVLEKGEKGINKILDWIDRIIPDKEEGIPTEKLREILRDLQNDPKEKLSEFGEWVKEKFEEGFENGKPKVENLQRRAKEFIKDNKDIINGLASVAFDFFKEHKEQEKEL